jgi:hypothetical protein
MHADIQREIRAHVAPTRVLQQRACDDWRVEFNHVRPHEALDMKTPSEIYQPSTRRAIVQSGALPSESIVRTVDRRGWISWNAQRIYIASAADGHLVGLVRVGSLVAVWLYGMFLGTFRYGEANESVQPAEAPQVSPPDTLSPPPQPLLPGDR